MYGIDAYSIFSLIIILVIMLLNMTRQSKALSFFVGLGVIYFAIFRVFSTRKVKRKREDEKFRQVVKPMTDFFSHYINKLKNIKDYKYIRCPKCVKELKVDRNKGKVIITCPHCGERFERET